MLVYNLHIRTLDANETTREKSENYAKGKFARGPIKMQSAPVNVFIPCVACAMRHTVDRRVRIVSIMMASTNIFALRCHHI